MANSLDWSHARLLSVGWVLRIGLLLLIQLLLIELLLLQCQLLFVLVSFLLLSQRQLIVLIDQLPAIPCTDLRRRKRNWRCRGSVSSLGQCAILILCGMKKRLCLLTQVFKRRLIGQIVPMASCIGTDFGRALTVDSQVRRAVLPLNFRMPVMMSTGMPRSIRNGPRRVSATRWTGAGSPKATRPAIRWDVER